MYSIHGIHTIHKKVGDNIFVNILDLLEEDKIKTKKEADTYNGEYSSSCPGCGGKDRFRIWPNQCDSGQWWCRQCSKSGDTIKYLTEFRKMTYQEACLFLGRTPVFSTIESKLKRLRQGYSETWEPKSFKAPSEQWQTEAKVFIEMAERILWSDNFANVRSWLHTDRGLKEETIKEAKLGWNPKDAYYKRDIWGLPPQIDENGKSKDLWIPAGLIITYVHNDQIMRIRIRMSKPLNELRYYTLPGSVTSIPMILNPGKFMVVVESDLDAILIHQEAKDLVGVVALGSAIYRPDREVTEKLRQAKLILIALDSDEAGGKTSWTWWMKHIPNAKRWCPLYGKDPTEAYRNGLNLRNWILAGLPCPKKVPDPVPSVDYLPTFGRKITYLSEFYKEKQIPYQILEDKRALENVISLIEDSSLIGIDVDSTGSDPLKDKIRFIQLVVPDKPVVIVDFEKFHRDDLNPLQRLLNGSGGKIFHDAKSNLKFLHQAGFRVLPASLHEK